MLPLKPLAITCLLSTPMSRTDVFSSMMEAMNQHMQDMENHMKHMETMMQSRQGFKKNPSITYDISEDDKNVTIQFKGIKSDKELNAIMGDSGNNLSIQTPQGTIKLRTKDRLLTVEITHKEEQKMEEKGHITSLMSMNNSSSSQLLENKLSLDNIELEYDQTTEIFKIILPKESVKNIPIKIKRK